MNLATVTIPLLLPILHEDPPAPEVKPKFKPSTADFLTNIPKDGEAALELSKQIAKAFAANASLKISTSILAP